MHQKQQRSSHPSPTPQRQPPKSLGLRHKPAQRCIMLNSKGCLWIDIAPRVSSKETKKIDSNRNRPKLDLFRFVSWKQKQKILVCFGVSNLYQNNWNKQNCFETNRNNPKFSEKYQNMLSIKLLVFCLFRFNQNIESFCFGIKNRNKRNKLFWN